MLVVGDSRFVDFTAAPQSGSSVQFVTVVVVAAKVIMYMCGEVVLAFEEMHNYTATLGFTLSRANTFFDCLRGISSCLTGKWSNPCFFLEFIWAPLFFNNF